MLSETNYRFQIQIRNLRSIRILTTKDVLAIQNANRIQQIHINIIFMMSLVDEQMTDFTP